MPAEKTSAEVQQAEDHLHITYIQKDIKDLKDGQGVLNKALQEHMIEELQIKGQIEQRLQKQETKNNVLLLLAAGAAAGSPELIKLAFKAIFP